LKELRISSSLGTSTICLGPIRRSLEQLGAIQKSVLITDRNVASLYSHLFLGCRSFILSPGEESKSLSTIEKIYRKFFDWRLDRSSTVIGFGGGVVGDITGFAASTYLRGLPFILIPTTLLSQADSSVGGKTGVNFLGYKNIIGTFTLPRFVLIDPCFLQTLPEEEILNGAAEIVKHALIASPGLFRFLKKEWPRLLRKDKAVLKKAVLTSIQIKSAIVCRDGKEKGERRKLNFGHTLGHALEKSCALSHGQAVAWAMDFAARLSCRLNLLSPDDLTGILTLLKNLFPSSSSLSSSLPPKESLHAAARLDKKREAEDIRFVFLSGIGKAVVKKIPYFELERLIDDLYQSG
jgi:3-dehydroquinate synthase